MTSGTNAAVRLKPNRDKPVRQGHPWIFSGAIEHIPPAAADGDIVDVTAADGRWLARGYLNRRSQIQVRLLTWVQEANRRILLARSPGCGHCGTCGNCPDMDDTNALRLVNAENDGLPGLTVDRFADYLVLQAGTLAIDQRKQLLADLLLELTGCSGVIERSEMALRRQEGLGPAAGLLAGTGADWADRGDRKRAALCRRLGARPEDRLLHGPTAEPAPLRSLLRAYARSGRSRSTRAQCLCLYGCLRRLRACCRAPPT